MFKKISQFVLTFAIITSWIFFGWPQIYNFPLKVQKVQAATVTAYATSNSTDGSLTGWTNPTYAYTDDNVNFATRLTATKGVWFGTLYGFNLSGIPDNSIINSVTITAEWKQSAATTNKTTLYLGAKSGGSEVQTGTSDNTGQTTFEVVTKIPAGLTVANLKATGANGFWAILRYVRTSNTNYTASVDYVKVVVDYTQLVAPTVTTQDASNVEATTATGNGNITDTGGQDATAWGVCYKTTSPCTTADSIASGSGTGGTGAFTASMTGLSPGTTYYIKAYATNSVGTSYGAEVSTTTKPAAPTNVSATKTLSDKVTITWTKSTEATGYKVYEGTNLLSTLEDIATYDDNAAAAPTITAGSAVASDGTIEQVDLSLSGALANDGASRTYKVVAFNTTGDSADSSADTGYRKVGPLTYQWQRSAGDSDAGYSDIGGATASTYGDAAAPAPTVTAGTASATDGSATDKVSLSVSGASANPGEGRYYKCVLSATGATQTISASNRGNRGVGSLTYQWQRSATDDDANYSDISGATTASFDDTGAPADGSGRYYKVVENATGATQQISTADRGYKKIVSISLTTDGSVNFGYISKNTAKDSTASGVDDVEVVRVDSGPADLDIKSTIFSQDDNTWALGIGNGNNTVKWEFSKDGSSWTTFANADSLYPLDTNVPQSTTRSVYFKITTPTLTNSYQQYGTTVTIVASAP